MDSHQFAPPTIPPLEKLSVETLGPATIPSPLPQQDGRVFVDDSQRILATSKSEIIQSYLDRGEALPTFELAGARENIYFDPAKTTCAITTCGGLCPGINNVARALVLTLHHSYGVKRILGIRYGYGGLGNTPHAEPVDVKVEMVRDIHRFGGTMLGSSRGTPGVEVIADNLEKMGIDVLFTIGGDGTLRGACALSDELARRNKKISVIAIPKTIDNDLHWVERSFGFTTAVSEASRVITAAHEEARGAWNGIGLVQLMGRYSGFIAAHASVANHDVNFCLIPEVPFTLDGKNGLLNSLERRLDEKHHAVIVVAEGAGQELMPKSGDESQIDKSGNVLLENIGPFLKRRILEHFKERGIETTVKFIDPSYAIRGLTAGTRDSEYCSTLAQCAVHAAMAGKTDMFLGHDGNRVLHVPNRIVEGTPQKKMDPTGHHWRRVLDSTGQPIDMT